MASPSRLSLFFKSLSARDSAVDLASFPKNRTFDIAISLGFGCLTRFHIDRIQRQRHFHRYVARSGFFDSLTRDQGHGCIADLVSNDFRLDAVDFEIKWREGDWVVYAPCYGLYFLHDFKFSAEDDKARRQVKMEQGRDKVVAKYRHQSRKFMNLLRSDLRILFVLSDERQLSGRTADAICGAFRAVNPNIDFSILQIAFADAGVKKLDHPDVIGIEIDNTCTDWTGNHASYDAAFRDIFIRPSPPVK